MVIAFIMQNPVFRKTGRYKCMNNSRRKTFKGEDVCAQLLTVCEQV